MTKGCKIPQSNFHLLGNLIFVYCNYRQPLTVQKGSEIRHSVAGHMVEVIELWLRGASHCDLVPGCLEAKLEQRRSQLVRGRVAVGEEDADVEVSVEVFVFTQVREVVCEPLHVQNGRGKVTCLKQCKNEATPVIRTL